MSPATYSRFLILTRWLLANALVDEMILIAIPGILGQGARLFPETGPDLALPWSSRGSTRRA